MKSIKRAPLWGRVGCILSVFLLLTNIILGVYSGHRYTELELSNKTLKKTINQQIIKIKELEKDNENLNAKILRVQKKNKKLRAKINKEAVTTVAVVKTTTQPTTQTKSKTQKQKTTSTNNGTNLGSFRISAYCNCSACCGQWAGGLTASGTTPTEGRTIAVDPSVIPLGSKVIIDGHTYVAEDTGSAIRGNRIDMYFSSHSRALSWGVQYKNVSIIK